MLLYFWHCLSNIVCDRAWSETLFYKYPSSFNKVKDKLHSWLCWKVLPCPLPCYLWTYSWTILALWNRYHGSFRRWKEVVRRASLPPWTAFFLFLWIIWDPVLQICCYTSSYPQSKGASTERENCSQVWRSTKLSLYLLFISCSHDTQSSCVFIRGKGKGPIVSVFSKNVSTVALSLWKFAMLPIRSVCWIFFSFFFLNVFSVDLILHSTTFVRSPWGHLQGCRSCYSDLLFPPLACTSGRVVGTHLTTALVLSLLCVLDLINPSCFLLAHHLLPPSLTAAWFLFLSWVQDMLFLILP